MKHSGAGWMQRNISTNMSKLGMAVADLLGEVYLGIYHLNTTSLKKVNWDDEYYIEFNLDRDMATVDFDELTKLVVLAHDRMIRVSISGAAPGYLKLLFHQRKNRNGEISQRCPTIETHVNQIHEAYGVKL